MAQMMLINPRRRGTKKRTVSMATKRRKTSTKRRKVAARRRPSTVTKRSSVTRSYRKNPSRRMTASGIVSKNIVPSLAGGVGALATNIGLAYLPLPDTLKQGPVNYAVRAIAAIGLGFIAGNFVKKETAQHLTNGALTVVMYDALKDTATKALPGVRMSAYDQDYDMGAFLPMEAYMSPALQLEGVFDDSENPFFDDIDEFDELDALSMSQF